MLQRLPQKWSELKLWKAVKASLNAEITNLNNQINYHSNQTNCPNLTMVVKLQTILRLGF